MFPHDLNHCRAVFFCCCVSKAAALNLSRCSVIMPWLHDSADDCLLQERCTAAEEAAVAMQEERDVLLADADAKNTRQMVMQDRISKLEVC